jgi:hypothetical protein
MGLFALLLILGWIIGFKAYIVNGWSSEPIVMYRSLAIVRPIKAENIKIGHFLSYRANSTTTKPITHRVISIENELGEVVAEFRQTVGGVIPEGWLEDGAYVVERKDLGINVVAWYSGEQYNETSTFNTQASNYSKNPFDSTLDISEIPYSFVYGVVWFSIANLGNVVLFIQNNIILVVATFACIILLYNMLYNELKARK